MTIKHIFASMAAILSLSAFAWPDWNGGAGDSDWWKSANWVNWREGEPAYGITPETLSDPYWGDWSFNNATGPVGVNLGGKAAKTGGLWIRYTGESFALTNGTLDTTGAIVIDTDNSSYKGVKGPTLVLKDINLTNTASINVGGLDNDNGIGTFVVEAGTTLWGNDIRMVFSDQKTSTYIQNGGDVRFHWFCCSKKGGGNGRIELNGGTLKVPDFTHSWEAPLNEENGTTNINMTLVFNGGTLEACTNNNNWVNADAFVPSWMKVNIGENGAVIDSNGYNLTFAATNITAVANDGGLTKKGAGTLKVDKGVVWSGPTKVLGGTLDLNGGTLTGPIVLGGNGKIVNATIATMDITVMGDYEYDLNISEWSSIGDFSRMAVGRLAVNGQVNVLSPLSQLLASAVVWYDPSDKTALTFDDGGGVVKIANKGAGGSGMDGTLFANDEISPQPPVLTTMNGMNAIALTNNVTGFRTDKAFTFGETYGKSVFAVSRRSVASKEQYGGPEEVYPIEWCAGGGLWDSNGLLGYSGQSGSVWYYYNTTPDEEHADGEWKWGQLYSGNPRVDVDETAYVVGVRANSRVEGDEPNIFARVTGLVEGMAVDVASMSKDNLRQNDGRTARVCYGWSMGHCRRSNGAVGEALAFSRCLSGGEADMVHSYLGHKWVSSEIPDAVSSLLIDTLELDGMVNFDGASVAAENLVGRGSISGAVSMTVSATTTAKLATDRAAITLDCPIDLTGTTIVLDESEFALAEYGQTATVFTATSITGTPTLQLAEGDRRRIKVRNTGTAIVVERVKLGVSVIVR